MPKATEFVLRWTNPDEAFEVALVLQSAALGPNGAVRDHGFLQDARDLFDQIEASAGGVSDD